MKTPQMIGSMWLIITVLSYLMVMSCGMEDIIMEIKNGDENMAKRIAAEHGLEYVNEIKHLRGVYHFREKRLDRVKRDVADDMEEILRRRDDVIWVERQKEVVREKRDLHPKQLFNDPYWQYQWYMFDNRPEKSNDKYKYDMHVIPVWNMNISGRGVRVTIVDDGIDFKHPDLKKNYDSEASYDFNDNDNDPTPILKPGAHNEHGTRCSSQVAMEANNNNCGVGIAYNSRIGGIRLLDGKVTSLLEAKALGYHNNHIDIYSSSWGPTDNGKTMELPNVFVRRTLENGVTHGRNGKGNIYVWASGNGGYLDDSCSCDGYVSSEYVISIGSVLINGKIPKFGESCPSTMAVTYSASGMSKNGIVAADPGGGCSTQHSGTSASAPMAAGIFALALEANPNLTWRDMKHLVAWTSQYATLKEWRGWEKNGAGFWVNNDFGFGLIDAKNLVKHAIGWKTVPEWTKCTVVKPEFKLSVNNKKNGSISINTDECKTKIQYIETVQVSMSFKYKSRGSLHIKLQSPSGYNTSLLPPRLLDESDEEMVKWPFMSVHQWGEKAGGNYNVYISDERKNSNGSRSGIFTYLSITFYGTSTIPEHVKKYGDADGRRSYDKAYNMVHNMRNDVEQ